MEYKRPGGDISTLLDLTNRDTQENDIFPLDTNISWFTRNQNRRNIPFVPTVQDFSFRGPASYGQRFTFDIGSLPCGDLIYGALVQIKLSHWLDLTTLTNISSRTYSYVDLNRSWYFANALGCSLIEKAELEIDGVTIEEIDGDLIYVFSSLFGELNSQFGIANDATGIVSIPDLMNWNPSRNFPIEDGNIFCLLPFFFMRTRLRASLPMVAIKEGSARIHITFRQFKDVIRQRIGYRSSCDSTPLGTEIEFNTPNGIVTKLVQNSVPDFQHVKLVTYGAYLDGIERNKMLRDPFEHLFREVQTFSFEEPLKYSVSKSSNDTVLIQLPLEANHPLEEIIWFLRLKDTSLNNEHTNFSAVLEKDYNRIYNPFKPLLKRAVVQANGITLCDASEDYYRQLISNHHRGGIVSYNRFIYGYVFANLPSEHQPSGSLNASRLSSLRLSLEVEAPQGYQWEVKVFCIGINWLRFENGVCNKLFED
jgi:hypothetical protein